jgi:hypothetical protein
VNEKSPGLAAELVAFIQVCAGFFGTVATVVVEAGLGVTLKLTVAPSLTHALGGLTGFPAEFKLIVIVGLAGPAVQTGISIILQFTLIEFMLGTGAQATINPMMGNAKRIFLFIVLAPV